MKNKKGFTLIELLAVLVVLAIIALISIPIVLGIIKSSRIKSEEASVRGYADAIKKAYSVWLIDHPNGTFNDFNYNGVEYSGNRVSCDNVSYNKGNIDLDCCAVGSNSTNYYSYENNKVTKYDVCPSKREYHIGDTFTLNGDDYYVIAASLSTQDYVVVLKAKPLKVSEIEVAEGTLLVTYTDTNQTGGTEYGSDITYATSVVKSVVDAWATSKFTNDELKTVDGYGARLITITELEGLGYIGDDDSYLVNTNVPVWVYNNDYNYWTMTPALSSSEWDVGRNGDLDKNSINYSYGAIRPVINVYKNKIPL